MWEGFDTGVWYISVAKSVSCMGVQWKLHVVCSVGVSAGVCKVCEPKALHPLLLM